MIRAVIKDGGFHPLEPLPEDWLDGHEVDVELVPRDPSPEELEEWRAEMERAAAEIDPADAEELQRILAEIDSEERAARTRESGVL